MLIASGSLPYDSFSAPCLQKGGCSQSGHPLIGRSTQPRMRELCVAQVMRSMTPLRCAMGGDTAALRSIRPACRCTATASRGCSS